MQSNMYQLMINQLLMKNPQAREMYENLKGKSTEELKQYAQNVAQGRGIDLKQFLGNYGIRI